MSGFLGAGEPDGVLGPVALSGTIGGAGAAAGVSTLGNTIGQTGTHTGTIVLAGIGAVTLSQATAPGQLTIFISGTDASGIAIAAGTQTGSSGTIVFSNSNNMSFGMAGSTQVTASASFPAQTVQPGIQSLSAGTTRITTGEAVFSNSNGVSFGAAGQTITASYTQSTSPAAIAAGTQTATSGTVIFSNSNGLSFGMAGSATVTATADYVRSVSAGTTNATGNQIVFSNSNNVSFGAAGATVTATATFSQSTQPGVTAIGVSTGGNTAGNTGTTQGTYVLAGAGVITLSQSTAAGSLATVTISATQSTSPAAIAAGTQTATSGTVIFSNSNGLTFGMAGSATVTATADYVRSISAGTTNATGNQIVLSNSNGISFGANGATITAQGVQVSFLDVPSLVALAENTADTALHFARFFVPVQLSATEADMLIRISNSTNAGGTVSLSVGVYTMSGSTASLASSASASFGYNSTAAASSYSNQSGRQYRSIALGTFNFTPGDYLIANLVSINTSGTSGTYNLLVGTSVSVVGAANYSNYFGTGFYSVSTTNFPASVHLSDIQRTGTGPPPIAQPWVGFAGTF